MKVLIATSEVFPYSKSGGLADMAGALAKSLARAGTDVGVVTPLYRGIRDAFPELKKIDWVIDLPIADRRVQGSVWIAKPAPRLTLYFVEHDQYYDRSALYQENGVGYEDNAERFIFLSKSVVQLARYLPWRAELVHVHDWQTALVPLLIRDQERREGWGSPPPTCLTIHNLAYQGQFNGGIFPLTNLPTDYFRPEGLEFYGGVNLLKGGITSADFLTTVSPRYAREITTEAFGCGMDGLLRRRQELLIGILNGVDYTEWKTSKNPCLPASYSIRSLDGKSEAKRALQAELGLPVAPNVPLFGNISRLVDQKGSDLQLGALEEMLSSPLQFVLLGSGAPELERAYLTLAKRYPEKVAVNIEYDHALAHRIEAGCDFFLMPSRFEPCGLNQMYSLRYGTIPIVRVTGGLDDSVVDATEDPDRADGIKFFELSSHALARGIRKALVLYADKELLLHYRKNGMSMDFSWTKTAGQYVDVYRRILAGRPVQRAT